MNEEKKSLKEDCPKHTEQEDKKYPSGKEQRRAFRKGGQKKRKQKRGY